MRASSVAANSELRIVPLPSRTGAEGRHLEPARASRAVAVACTVEPGEMGRGLLVGGEARHQLDQPASLPARACTILPARPSTSRRAILSARMNAAAPDRQRQDAQQAVGSIAAAGQVAARQLQIMLGR